METTLRPNVYMIAGANGSGKTTAIMTLLPKHLSLFNFINADEIAKGLSPLSPEDASIDAGRLMIRQLNKIIDLKKDFAFETTGSGLGHLRTLEKCRINGYYIHIIYLYLNSENIAVKRVDNRVKQGGHNVPQADIKRRYLKGLKNIFFEYTQSADFIEIIDNSYGLMEVVASKKHKNDDWYIENTDIWQEIQHKVNI